MLDTIDLQVLFKINKAFWDVNASVNIVFEGLKIFVNGL